MLKSIHRLSTKQFMEFMEKGRIYTSPFFVVRVLVGNNIRSDKTKGIVFSESLQESSLAISRQHLAPAGFTEKIVPVVAVHISAVASKITSQESAKHRQVSTGTL